MRSLMGAYNDELQARGKERQARTSGGWSQAYKQFQWKERAEAWDEHQRQLAEAEVAARRAASDEARERRIDAFQERSWNLAERLLDKAEKMLDFPLIEKHVETSRRTEEDGDGRTIKVFVNETIIKPAGWNFNSAARLIATADNVARLSCDMATARLVLEAANMTDEELDRELETIGDHLQDA